MKISPRHLIWVNLALLTLVAYWGASTVSTAIAAKLTPPPEVHLSQPPPPIAREPRRPLTHYASINTRDIFNSTKEEEKKPEAPPVPTKLNLKLWGVAVHTDGSSRCVIEDLSTRKQDVYGIGARVAGVATVKLIEWDRVILDRDGQDEILDLQQSAAGGLPGAGGAVPGRPVPPVAAAAPATAPGQSGQSANPHIQQVSDTEYRIDRSEVDQALDNMNQLFTQIRAVPHFEGGQSTGFRLFAIRQNSIFDQIGLRNGDIIQSINGSDISDPSRALALVQELRNQNQLAVGILRNKEKTTLNYSFR